MWFLIQFNNNNTINDNNDYDNDNKKPKYS